MNILLKKIALCTFASFLGQMAFFHACFAACSTGASAQPQKLAVGFNLTHTSIDLSKVSECKNFGAGETLEKDTNIVRNYQRSSIQTKTIDELKEMSQQGATVLRTFIWLEPNSENGNRIGAIDINSDNEIRDAGENLASFLRNADGAGYSHVFVALAPLSTLAPNCRHNTWGDCYNASEISRLWGADKEIISLVKSKNPEKPKVTFDLGNELCFDDGPNLVDTQKMFFVKTIAENYTNSFHNRNFTISCTAPTAELLIRRLNATYKLLKQDQTLPNVITLHLSQWPEESIDAVARTAIKIAHDINATIAIDEIPYDSPKVYASIAKIISHQNDTRIESILFWPNSPKTQCNFSVSAPYNLQPMEAALGISACH